MLGAGALGWPRGMVWGGKREEGSGWGTHVYLWQIHFDIWQNQYNIVKFKNKIKLKKNSSRESFRIIYLIFNIASFFFKWIIEISLVSFCGAMFTWLPMIFNCLHGYLHLSKWLSSFLFHTWQSCFSRDSSSKVNSVWVSRCVHW